MEQFSLEKYLKNTSRKVVTRGGRPVRIVCWDSPNKAFPIVGFVDNEPKIFVWDFFGYCREGHIETDFDLFFADDEKELTEFEKKLKEALYEHSTTNTSSEEKARQYAPILLDLARKEIEKENSEFKSKFTYNEKDYSKLANKLIEFRNNTPLCSVSYRDGDGRNVILQYEKEIFELVKNEIFQDLPKWKDSWSTCDSTKPQIIGDCLVVGDNLIHISDLVNKLPKEK